MLSFLCDNRPMLTMDVKTDIAQALKRFQALEPRQFPFIVSLAMNRTMRRIKDVQRAEMQQVFDNPVPFTLNSLMTAAATKQNLEAELRLRQFAGKGVPASKYLAPQIYGGPRRMKRFEVALQAKGILPAGMFAVPANGAPINANGNLPGPYIVRMLSYLQAFGEQGYRANRTAATTKRAAAQFFAISADNQRGLPLGIYERRGAGFRMVIAFVKQPTYAKRYPFFEISQREARRYLAKELEKAAEYALRTSRSSLTLADFTRALSG